MRPCLRFSTLAAIVLATLLASPLSLYALDGQVLARQVYDREDGKDSQATGRMLLIDKRGAKRLRAFSSAVKDYGDTSKSFIRFTSPADIKGTSFLTWENKDRDSDQFLYLPALKRVRRIVSTQKASQFVNTDYTYEDMERRKPDLDQHQIVGEAKILDRDCWILESIPKTAKTSQYEKRKIWIVKDILLPVKVEYYGKGNNLQKEFSAVVIKQIDGIWVIMESTMRDLKKNHQTLLKTEAIKFNQGIADNVFSEAYMMHGE